MRQGKRKDQIDFSSRMTFIGFVGLTLCFIWGLTFLPDAPPPKEGIPHNYYHPAVWGHDTLPTKNDKDWTGTTQGEMTEEEMLSQEPDFIYYDTVEAKREADSVDAYMKYWYEVLDTNSNGEIDDTEYDGNDENRVWVGENGIKFED